MLLVSTAGCVCFQCSSLLLLLSVSYPQWGSTSLPWLPSPLLPFPFLPFFRSPFSTLLSSEAPPAHGDSNFRADGPKFCKLCWQDGVCLYFEMLRLSPRLDDIKPSPTVVWLAGDVDSRCLVLSSFLVSVAQPTGWQGTMSSTKRKENDPTATINNNRDPVLFSFLWRRRSTHWMAGNNIVQQNEKRAIRRDNLQKEWSHSNHQQEQSAIAKKKQ